MTLQFFNEDDQFDAGFASLIFLGKQRGFISNEEFSNLLVLRDDDSAQFVFGVIDAFEAHGIRILEADGLKPTDREKRREPRPWN